MPEIPKGAKKPADRLQAEVAAEDAPEYTGHDFKGQTFRVLRAMDWDKSAMSAINNLDFNGWAAGALHPDDMLKFRTIRATFRETTAWIGEVTSSAGVDVGELFASQDS